MDKTAISLFPIGHVENTITERKDNNWGEVNSRIILRKELHEGLLGLESFSYAIIVTFLHQSHFERTKHLQRRPRNLEYMPLLGIFSQRAKNRPNPIGITAAKIIQVKDDFLEVKGLDAINSTPVLDIKPYYHQYDAKPDAIVPEWVYLLMQGYF